MATKKSVWTRLWWWVEENPKKAVSLAGLIGMAVGGKIPWTETLSKALTLIGAG